MRGQRAGCCSCVPGQPYYRLIQAMHVRVAIIGGGPAAHTAATYLGRAELQPVLFEGFMANGEQCTVAWQPTHVWDTNMPLLSHTSLDLIVNPCLLTQHPSPGIAPGGQLTTTTYVENFPGFPIPIMGHELCDRFRWVGVV